MLRQSSRNSKHVASGDSVLQYGKIASQVLRDISEATSVPYLKTIAGVSQLIVDTVEVCQFERYLVPGRLNFLLPTDGKGQQGGVPASDGTCLPGCLCNHKFNNGQQYRAPSCFDARHCWFLRVRPRLILTLKTLLLLQR